MMIFLEHPKHGRKVAYLQLEAEADKANGWTEYDPKKEKADGLRKKEEQATAKEEVVAPVDIREILQSRGIQFRKNASEEKLQELLEESNGRADAN